MVPETPREHGTTRCLPCPWGEHNPYHLGIWDNSEDPGGWHVWSPRAKQDRTGGHVSLPGLEARFQLSYHHLSNFSPSIMQTRNTAGASPELNEGQFVNPLLISPLNLCFPTRQNTFLLSLSIHLSFSIPSPCFQAISSPSSSRKAADPHDISTIPSTQLLWFRFPYSRIAFCPGPHFPRQVGSYRVQGLGHHFLSLLRDRKSVV